VPDSLDQLASELADRLGWSQEAAFLGLRAGFCCEYCDRPLLRSVEDYDTWQNDHVLPTNRGGSDDYKANKALACKMCNFLKRHTLLEDSIEGLNRDQLVVRFRAMIQERRRRKDAEFGRIQEVFRELGLTAKGLSA
jgi:hypothetical protein